MFDITLYRSKRSDLSIFTSVTHDKHIYVIWTPINYVAHTACIKKMCILIRFFFDKCTAILKKNGYDIKILLKRSHLLVLFKKNKMGKSPYCYLQTRK